MCYGCVRRHNWWRAVREEGAGSAKRRGRRGENFGSSVSLTLLPPPPTQRVAKAWIDATTGLRQDVNT